MKQLLDGSCDFIINSRGIPNTIDGKPDFIGDDKTRANGKYFVDSVYFYVDSQNEYNNRTGQSQRVYITNQDIKMLYHAILEIESKEQVISIEDDLPF